MGGPLCVCRGLAVLTPAATPGVMAVPMLAGDEGSFLAALRPEAFRHTSFYCEENVWRLCEDLIRGRADAPCGPAAGLQVSPGCLKAVFVSNAEKKVAFWHQRTGSPSKKGHVVWDYHVFAVLESCELGAHVLDLDTMLQPFPLPFVKYATRSLRPRLRGSAPTPPRQFRVIDAEEFLNSLCSDRSHMRTATGDWQSPPPPEPQILCSRRGCADGRTSNLFSHFVSMDPGTGAGEVFSEEAFLARFGWHSGD